MNVTICAQQFQCTGTVGKGARRALCAKLLEVLLML